MPPDLRRLEKDLETAVARARTTARMRFGIVGGLMVVALFRHPAIQPADGAGVLAAARAVLTAFAPLLGIAAVGALVVVALMRRDIRRARAQFEAKRGFRIPKRPNR